MATLTEVIVPDIGDFDAIPVIEILVAPGDAVTAETPLITLESDKATMDIPAPRAGVVREIKVALGDKVSQGMLIALLDTGADAGAEAAATRAEDDADSSDAAIASWDLGPAPSESTESPGSIAAQATDKTQASPSVIEITVPDIGDFDGIPVIELLVKVGDRVHAETPLVTLESDKATMDVPAPQAGTITAVKVAVGDSVSQGSVVALLRIDADAQQPATAQVAPTAQPTRGATAGPAAGAAAPPSATAPAARTAPSVRPANDAEVSPADESMQKYHSSEPDPRAPLHRPAPTAGLEEQARLMHFHATPAIRRFARELGVNLAQVNGSGRKGRIVREDIAGFVKGALSTPVAAPSPSTSSNSTMGIEPIPTIDFSRFGHIEEQKLSRIKRISGPVLGSTFRM